MRPYYFFLNRNKNGDGFQELRNGEIFVDKTGLIEEINSRNFWSFSELFLRTKPIWSPKSFLPILGSQKVK